MKRAGLLAEALWVAGLLIGGLALILLDVKVGLPNLLLFLAGKLA
ncbi:MAG: hypothetical protein ACT4P3_07355 [Betaproteobacteria bacterium]